MARYAFNKSSRGQIRSWANGGSESDAQDWINILPFFPLTTSSYNRNGFSPKSSRDLAESTTLGAPYLTLTVTNLWVWISLGYKLDANTGAFRDTIEGTCIDALEEFTPKFRLRHHDGSSWSTVVGLDTLEPSSGLAVHATVRPDYLLALYSQGGTQQINPSAGVPILGQLFYQAYEQPVPMTYHRDQKRNFIPADAPVAIAQGDKMQVEMMNGADPSTKPAAFEFDCWVQGYLED